MHLGKILSFAQRNDISTIPAAESPCVLSYHDNVVVKGPFHMQVNSHSTGYGVRIYIVGKGDPYLIRRETIWKAPGFCEAEPVNKSGKWDQALNECIEELRDEVKVLIEERERTRKESEIEKEAKEVLRRSEVEEMFENN